MSGYVDLLLRRSQLSRPRATAAMSHIDQYNVECYLAWRSKWDRRFVGRDAWAPIARFYFTQFYTEARHRAQQFLAGRGLSNVVPFRKPARIRFHREST